MRLLWHLVAKDLRRKARSPLGVIAVLAFPLIFAGMIALAFGRGTSVPKVRMLVDNQDGGLLGGAVASVFTSQRAAAYFDGKPVTAEQGSKLMEAGKASAMLTIPAGFTQDLLDGRPVVLRLVRNPSEGVLPEIAEQTAGALTDVLDGGRRVFDEPIADLRPLLGREGGPADAEVIAVSLAVKRAIETSSTLILPPVITLESELFGTAPAPAQPKKSSSRSLIFLAVLPGVAVYGLFLVAEQGMRDVITERTMGTLRRQLASPVRPSTVILGKALYTAVLAALAILILAIVGATALGSPVSVIGFLLVSASLVLAVTGTNAAIYGLSRSERQAATIGNIIFLAMGFLGGGFIRIEGLPPAVQAIAPFTPLYWGTRGYRALLESGAGPDGVLLPAAVLASMGVVLLSIGAAALHRVARA